MRTKTEWCWHRTELAVESDYLCPTSDRVCRAGRERIRLERPADISLRWTQIADYISIYCI